MKGLFITFEGGDGSGKSTLIEAIYQLLTKRGYPLLLTREPGGTKLSEEIRKILMQHYEMKVSDRAELCLFLAARAQQMLEKIKPALQDKMILLCDRFNDSTVAYQGYARGLGLEETEKFCAFVTEGITPDLTILLDIDPESALSRAKKFSEEKRFDRIESEALSFHSRVREGYHLLAKKHHERFFIVDSSLPFQEVFLKVSEKVDHLLQLSGWQLHAL